ncbi:MAG: VOC family protein [Streptosporangiaceae bacterium]
MVFWQLTIDANDPALLARFWAQALGYQPAPPAGPDTPWHQHYRARLGKEASFDDRLFDPAGLRPPIWFQQVPETKAGKNRLHVDVYPTGRDSALPLERQVEIVEAKVADPAGLGGACSGAPGTTTPMTRSTTWSCTTRRATSFASAEHCSGWCGERSG